MAWHGLAKLHMGTRVPACVVCEMGEDETHTCTEGKREKGRGTGGPWWECGLEI